MRMIIILLVLLLLVSFGFVVMTAAPGDREQHEAYERYKERVAKCAYKDDRTEEEKVLSNCMSELEGAWKDERHDI